jgi:hypothetical protein
MSTGTRARGLRVVVLSRSARNGTDQTWGLGVDAKVVEQILREISATKHTAIASVDHLEATTFVGGRRPEQVDVAIHLEVPCRAAMIWASYNIVVVNQEWWFGDAWKWATLPVAAGGADMFVFKSAYARSLFPEVEGARCRVIPWRCAAAAEPTMAAPRRREFLYLVGASVHKASAAAAVIAAWRPTYLPLTVVATPPLLERLRSDDAVARGIRFREPYATDEERMAAQTAATYHVVASAAEGYGMTFAEAASCGALPLWTQIPVYEELYGGVLGEVGRITASSETAPATGVVDVIARTWSTESIATAVESLLGLSPTEDTRLRAALRTQTQIRNKEFRQCWRNLIGGVSHKLSRAAPPAALPPRAPPAAELPHVAIITLTRNRPKWFANMARNVLLTDYPRDKLVWVVADDGDAAIDGRVDMQIAKFTSDNPSVAVRYVSLPRALPIGEKRNRACAAAPDAATIFMMMDDDDHYPKSSVIARICWLLGLKKECVYCATIPMYDAARYISAINVPPLDLPPQSRVSEATLAFTRAFWTAHKFPASVSVAEGEDFIGTRYAATAEVPPDGIIVSLLHGANSTSRRVPDRSMPNGCHYGFDDAYFSYISGLAVPTPR